MAASSPAPSSNSKIVKEPPGNVATGAAAAVNGNVSRLISAMEAPPMPKSQRGQNKPKCIKCGNVARSRCPFQSCKNCCATAQNPCHIHVLKQTSILPAQPPPSSPLPEQRQQPSTDTSSTGASWRLSSLRRLSTAFANSIRVKKPLTRKDALNINKWRFLKLKEHIESNIEAENEAFDRYMWNVSLMEEAFSTEGLSLDAHSTPESKSSPEDEFEKLVSSMKVNLKSNSQMTESYRARTRELVDKVLLELQKDVAPDEDLTDAETSKRRKKAAGEGRAERTAAFHELIDKLSKARSEDDLKPCLEMKLQLLSQTGSTSLKPLEKKEEQDDVSGMPVYSLPKVCTAVNVDQDVLSHIYAEFSSAGQLAEL